MFTKSIKSRVWSVINRKIDEAQKTHDEHCKMLEQKLEADKLAHEDSMVKSLVGKFL